ncbi:patatin-like protein [Actinosynnema sp. NPDC047251]|uniref:Patatin-like phospholipase n=1 Tax=Saccharothrix espanaensis (strain ATCC 51144 / DSM 44229 / JCM 9112 / NBRC 15066 / NRRL 15764) TaxID=1179773 RepID=K0JZR7_SACES|nr:patatin-like protein [Saccharothrix espanaensis]CCH33485.1 Patatin-like phospholipase [Saccharothrix espanaensis DSM 44229]
MADVPREQIRFAVVLNGGVSLAVWMGGVVLELDRLTRGDGVYADLLDLVGSTARADVITGTSAGGINGAALALSQVNGNAKLERLRDLWAEQGRMEQLLRTPFRGSPVSLLKGDEFFLPRLHEALDRLTTDFSPTPADERPVDLRITTTLLGGVPTVTHDDLGQALVQSSYQGSFSFRREPGGRDDFTADRLPTLVDRMALAARSSASFPFAFEPSYVPVGPETNNGRPNMADVASWANGADNRSRYAVDGGVLVNTPTKEALEAIDRMPAEGPVRRVMLLVFPHAKEDADAPTAPVDGKPPSTIGTGARLLSALTSQSGRTYVERIEEHNRLAASRRGGRSALLDRLAASGSVVGKLYALAATLHDHYEDIRIRHAARDVTSRQFEVPGANAAGWTFERVRASAEAAQRSYLAKWGGLPYVPNRPQPATLPEHGWPWGIGMAERLAAAAMDLLKRLVWVVSEDLSGGSRLAQARTNLYELRTGLRAARAELDGQWTTGEKQALNQEYWEGRVEAFAAGMLPAASGDSVGQRVRAQVDRIAGILADARDVLDGLDEDRVAMAGVASWRKLLVEPRTDEETAAGLLGNDLWLSRVLALEVAVTCLADDSRSGMDQAVDLVQISLQTRNAFADHSTTPDDKAGGASLSRFSGFLKRSWRVNDWIWGRVDGATMLCKVVFDPKRLLRIDRLTPSGSSAAERARERVGHLVGKLFGEGLPASLQPVVERAVEELTALYGSSAGDHPPTCEALAELAAWGLHVRIICEELPALRASILADRNEGADRRSRGELFLEEQAVLLARLPVRTDAQRVEIGMEALAAFDRAGIGREPLSQEASSDQVIRTAATAAAVAITVADSENSGLGPAKPLTRTLRGAALLPYWTITGLTRGGRLAQFLGLLGFALGGALLVLALFDLLPPWAVGPAAAFGSATLLAAFGYAALRTGTLLHGLVLLSPVIPLTAVAVDRTRIAMASGVTEEQGVTGMVALGGVVLVVLGLLVIGSLPAPVGTPLAVLKKIRLRPRLLVRMVVVAGIVAGIWAVVRYRLYDVDATLVVIGTAVAIVFGATVSLRLGRSLQRWRQIDGVWDTENAEPPAAATAGWAAVYGSVLLVIGAAVQVFTLRFVGWEAVLATALSFGLVLLLVTTWWVPLKARRRITRNLVEQASFVDFGGNVAAGLLKRLEGHAMLFRFLTTVDGHGHPVLGPAGLRVAQRIAHLQATGEDDD